MYYYNAIPVQQQEMRSKGNLQSSSEYGGNYYYYYVKLPVLKKSLGMRKNLDQPVSTADWFLQQIGSSLYGTSLSLQKK